MEQVQGLDLAREYLNSEIDLKNILQMLRLSKFLVKVNMSYEQRQGISFSRKFIIDRSKVKQKLQKQKMNQCEVMQAVDEIVQQNKGAAILDKLVDGLDPGQSKIDKRIIYELTGLFDAEFYLDETDREDNFNAGDKEYWKDIANIWR